MNFLNYFLFNCSNLILHNQPHEDIIQKTLIDNIHLGVVTPNTVLGNFTATISDPLPHFYISDIF